MKGSEMKVLPHSALLALPVLIMTALATYAEDQHMLRVEEIEKKPVNCATAEGDLRVLRSEREHAEKTGITSVTAITPSGAIIGIITGTEKRKLQMLSGDYIKHIDETIAQIQQTCKL
jgi:hypothetical protein